MMVFHEENLLRSSANIETIKGIVNVRAGLALLEGLKSASCKQDFQSEEGPSLRIMWPLNGY